MDVSLCFYWWKKEKNKIYYIVMPVCRKCEFEFEGDSTVYYTSKDGKKTQRRVCRRCFNSKAMEIKNRIENIDYICYIRGTLNYHLKEAMNNRDRSKSKSYSFICSILGCKPLELINRFKQELNTDVLKDKIGRGKLEISYAVNYHKYNPSIQNINLSFHHSNLKLVNSRENRGRDKKVRIECQEQL